MFFNFSENAGFTEVQTFKGHTNYVVSVAILKESDILPNGLILTGGNDTFMCGFFPESSAPVFLNTSHTNTGEINLKIEASYLLNV